MFLSPSAHRQHLVKAAAHVDKENMKASVTFFRIFLPLNPCWI